MKRTPISRICWLGLLLGLGSASLSAAQAPAAAPAVPLPGQSKDAFLDSLMQRMTLEEKIGQLRLVSVGPDHPKPVLLKEIAEGRGVSVSIIVAEIQAQDRRTNLSSAIRLFVLEHACERCAAAENGSAPRPVQPAIAANA